MGINNIDNIFEQLQAQPFTADEDEMAFVRQHGKHFVFNTPEHIVSGYTYNGTTYIDYIEEQDGGEDG